jgi:hypothetical protein
MARVHSIFWDLLIEGIIRPGINDGVNLNLPHYHVTEWGQQVVAAGSEATPYDPDGYLSRLQTAITSIDPVVVTYLNESLHTLRIGCLLSSTIAVGCASEKAFLLLVDAYAAALPSGAQKKFRDDTNGKMIKRQSETFQKRLNSHLKPLLPGDLAEGIDIIFSSVFEMIRNQRNSAGHPTGKIEPRETVYATLTVFPEYLKKVYALIDWLHQQGPGGLT